MATVYVQDFWKKCGDLGLLGITAPGELCFQSEVHVNDQKRSDFVTVYARHK